MDKPGLWRPKDKLLDGDDDRSSAAILGIMYRVSCGLIIVSNLLMVLLIIFTNLRRHSFYWKMVMCSVGDILFGITFAFQVESFINPINAWQYGEVFCQITRYIDATHLVFISFVLTSLCINRILKITTRPGLCSTIVLVLLLLFPIIAAYFAIIPLFAHYRLVTFTTYTSIRQNKFSTCKLSTDYKQKNILAVVIVEIIQNTIFLPALFLLVMLLIWVKRKRQSIRDIVEGDDCDDTLSSTDSTSSENLMSSGVATLIVTIVTILCTAPNSILYFCSPGCVPRDATNTFSTSIRHYLFLLLLVPSFTRPYIWIFDSEIRRVIRIVCCRRCSNSSGKTESNLRSGNIQLTGR